MANKTAEKISPDAFLNEMNAINDKAKDAVIDLLNKQGDKRYIAVPDWEDECEGDDGDGSELSIFGIGRTASSISMSMRWIYDDAVVEIITETAETLQRE